ncbi:MAG: hypothetical protein NC548_22365 [Lachnospiraceae bacterium]|nr:hypothetical protein [Lachnospiraceae bacterium]
MEIKVQDFIKIIEPADRLQIIKDGEVIYTNFLAMLDFTEGQQVLKQYGQSIIKKFRATPEIRHKEWKKRGLMKPLQPDETPDISFSDLQMTLYYTIHI